MRSISASVYQRVSTATRPSGRDPLLGRAPEVDPAGELADDEHVHAGQQLRAERRGRHERRVDGDRPQVRVQPEPAAQREQGLLRADPRVRVVPARTADGAKEDRVGRPAALHVLGQDGQPVGVDGRAAGEHVRPVEPEPEGLARRVEDGPGMTDHLRPDPVAGDGDEPVERAVRARVGADVGRRS